ncbi:MAG: hypothetical protein ACREFK_19690, partial [Stellaceae bacterium]
MRLGDPAPLRRGNPERSVRFGDRAPLWRLNPDGSMGFDDPVRLRDIAPHGMRVMRQRRQRRSICGHRVEWRNGPRGFSDRRRLRVLRDGMSAQDRGRGGRLRRGFDEVMRQRLHRRSRHGVRR